jgi:hypothetical protein
MKIQNISISKERHSRNKGEGAYDVDGVQPVTLREPPNPILDSRDGRDFLHAAALGSSSAHK